MDSNVWRRLFFIKSRQKLGSCHFFKRKAIRNFGNLFNFAFTRNIWKCPKTVLPAVYNCWRRRWSETTFIMGFVEKQDNWNLSPNVANFRKGTPEKFAINGDGNCLRFSARFQINNRNGFYSSPIMGLLFPFHKGLFEKDESSRIIRSLQGWSTSERVFAKNFCKQLSAIFLCARKVLSIDAKHKCWISEERLSRTRFFSLSKFRTYMVQQFSSECVQCLCAPSYFTYNPHKRGT